MSSGNWILPKEKQEKGLGEEIQAKIKEGEKGKKKKKSRQKKPCLQR